MTFRENFLHKAWTPGGPLLNTRIHTHLLSGHSGSTCVPSQELMSQSAPSADQAHQKAR